MTIYVTDTGFGPATGPAPDLELGPDADPGTVALDHAHIRVTTPSFADGRIFTIAARLRARGFAGRLTAAGHVIADQYAMARRSGFDAVEIDDALAARQPEDQWLARADWRARHYQARLKGRNVAFPSAVTPARQEPT